jgi:Spy/CpxP family protein refolding chaperone
MSSIPEPSPWCACPQTRLRRAQTAIRALIARGRLTPEQRLELATWQREWVAAWRESRYVIAA